MKLHHVGIVVGSLETVGAVYAAALGLEAVGPPVDDEIQEVRVQFWARRGDAVSVELIEPLRGSSPAARQVGKGGGFAHLCYEVLDIDAEVQKAWERGGIVVRTPIPAAAFDNRRIAFVCFRDIGVVEFVEQDRRPDNHGGA